MPTIDLGKVIPSINGKEAIDGNIDLTHTDVDAVAQPETEDDTFTDGTLSPWVDYKDDLNQLKESNVSLSERIDRTNALEDDTVIVPVTRTLGNYIKADGSVGSDAAFSITQEIDVLAGDVITARGYSLTRLPVIAIYYDGVFNAADSKNRVTDQFDYTATATADGYAVVTMRKDLGAVSDTVQISRKTGLKKEIERLSSVHEKSMNIEFIQGSPYVSGQQTRVTSKWILAPYITRIVETGADSRMHLYATGKGYLTSDGVFVDSIGSAKSGKIFDMTAIRGAYPGERWLLVVQNDTGATPSVESENVECYYNEFEKMQYEPSRVNPLYGKTIVNMGDSIFGKYRDTSYANESISHMIASKTGANCINVGIGGTRSNPVGAANDPLSFTELVAAKLGNDYTAADAYVSSHTDNVSATESLASWKGLDLTNVDIVTVAYGTNDWSGNMSAEAYADALTVGISQLMTAYPNLRVYVCTPTIRFIGTDDEGEDWAYDSDDEQAANSKGDKISDFASAALDAAKTLHLRGVDNYWPLGVNRHNKMTFFGTSGVHPILAGRVLIADRLIAAMSGN